MRLPLRWICTLPFVFDNTRAITPAAAFVLCSPPRE